MNISRLKHALTHSFIQIRIRAILCLICFFIISGSFILDAEQTWQGNAAMIRRGEFAEEGFYAASNSFPLNTKIRIKNLNNNRSTEVVIIQRIQEFYNVFLLLSEDAAIELGMSDNDVINVEVVVLKFGTGDTIGLPDDLTYNPDPDVFPLPTVLEVTPFASGAPTPVPEITPTPVPVPEETYEPVPESTFEPTTEPTLEPVVPEPTAESTFEPTPEMTAEPIVEMTAEPTPELIESPAPDSDKLLFLPPHEDEMYVLTDVVKPLILDEEDVTDVEIDDASITEGKAVDGSIKTPKYTDDEDDLSSIALNDPDIENPVIEDKTDPEKSDVDVIPDEIADIPELLQKEESVPDPSDIMPDPGVYELGAIPVEPEVPEKGSDAAEIAEVVPGKKEQAIALDPGEPFIPEEKGKESGELSNEEPDPLQSEIVFDPKEPDIKDKEGEAPELISKVPGFKDKDIALVPGEPEPPPETGKDLPDPSNIIPDASKDTELAKIPEEQEPDPPIGKEKDTPDPSNIIPDASKDTELAKTPEEPDPPIGKEKDTPDPSNIIPEITDEVELAKTPEDPDLFDPTPDVVITPTTEPVPTSTPGPTDTITDEDVDVIITFEATDPQPPTDKDKDTSVVKENNKDKIPDEILAKGTYFIQLAAYTDKEIAIALENKYKKLYPVKMYEIKDKKIEVYKVLVGPLNKYESDTLLYRFKALGYKDAFVRYNN